MANRNGSDAAPAEATAPAPVADAAAEAMKRFTIDVPETLHRRVKAQCAGRGVKMADVIRDLLEREFPDGVGAR
ncbi:plasmid partition protein ParG [Methyloraptor flagellatus]|uniref:Plasmid partition protein ParG n=1 Tax=Methyloraptor flagellatus TaxID=3162530 RepID=A0AAU7XHV3_9HYPH